MDIKFEIGPKMDIKFEIGPKIGQLGIKMKLGSNFSKFHKNESPMSERSKKLVFLDLRFYEG